MKLRGKTVLITGAAKRLGKAIALALAKRGAHIILHYHASRAEAQETLRQIRKMKVRAVAVEADLSSVQEIERLFCEARRHFRRLDVLINNAAAFGGSVFGNISERDWDRMFDTNLKGLFFCTQEAVRWMNERKNKGKIINLTDSAGLRPYPKYLVYSLSKMGAMGLTQALAKILAPAIYVNAIAPGTVLFHEGLSKAEKQNIIRHIPLRRTGSIQDIVNAVLYLIEGSDYVTGATVTVDGGRSLA